MTSDTATSSAARRRPPHRRRPPDRAPLRRGPRAALHAQGHPAEVVLRHRGSQLFDDITRLPEYYPTRCERAILVERADEIADGHPGRHARRARLGNLRQDADPARRAARRGHDHALRSVRRERADPARRGRGGEPRLPVGASCTRSSATSSITSARFPTAAAASSRSSAARSATSCRRPAPSSCSRSRRASAPTTTCCSVSTSSRTSTASKRRTTTRQGVTAEFNKNVLAVMNRELDADFDVDALRARRGVRHGANARIEMRLRARRRRTPCRCARSSSRCRSRPARRCAPR